jgi:DAK2 domain fusion protein YloV
MADARGDLEAVLAAAVDGAAASVARTPSLLPILRDAGVVDAGGQGLFRLLQGAQTYLQERYPRRSVVEAVQRAGARAALGSELLGAASGSAEAPVEEAFGYETMFLLHARDGLLDVDALRAELERMGESVLVAGDSRAVKVHVHNVRPDEVIALGLSLGSLTRVTVENLDSQSNEVREKRAAQSVATPIDHRLPADRHETRPLPHVNLDTYGAELPAGAEGSNGRSAAPATESIAGTRTATSGEGSSSTATVTLAVIAVAAGEGLARIFNSYGVAAVVRGGQTNNPSTGELLDAVERIAADEILLLPNNPNVVLAARQAGEMTSRRVRVVPTRNAAEGFAALLALDPQRDATANAEVMTLAGRAVQTLQVTEAVRDAVVGGRKVRKGQTIVLDPDDGLLAVGSDRTKAVLGALEALEPGFELVTLYCGEAADLMEASLLRARIEAWRSGVEVEVLQGGQPHYRYLISAE